MPVIQEENGGESKQADTAMSDVNVGDLDNSDIDFSDFESADEGADVHPVDSPSESQRTETFKQKWETSGPLLTELNPMAGISEKYRGISEPITEDWRQIEKLTKGASVGQIKRDRLASELTFLRAK
jgi:hypothetical protein